MFTLRRPSSKKAQKRRSWRLSGYQVWAVNTQHLSWVRILALGTGYAPFSLIERFFIWSKRVTSQVSTLRKFWVNVQVALPVTRKPANVRMGKGKGSKAGIRAFVSSGLPLLSFSSIRSGTLASIYRRAQVRCPFRLGVSKPLSVAGGLHDFRGKVVSWIRLKRTQPRYVTLKFNEYQDMLRHYRRPLILGYFLRILRWHTVVPSAQWSPAQLHRYQSRPRRWMVKKRRYLARLRPLRVSFLRQFRTYVRAGLRKLRIFRDRKFGLRRKRWVRQVWPLLMFKKLPNLPWHMLLRAKQYRRLLPLLSFVTAQSLNLGVPGALQLITDTGGEGQLMLATDKLHLLALKQTFFSVFLFNWYKVISTPTNFRWVRRKKVI